MPTFSQQLKVFIYCIIGNTLEWYDFAIFGVLSPILSTIFFPHKTNLTALLLTLSVFATGFIMRPLGGILWGHIGDKYGRKKAIVGSVFLMTVATVGIGALPVGHLPLVMITPMLILLRMLQGIAVSGEDAGATTFINEWMPKQRIFFYQGIAGAAASAGFLLGAVAGNIALAFYHGNATSNAWRFPFLLSAILGMVGLYLRLKAVETTAFIDARQHQKLVPMPVVHAFKHHFGTIIFSILLIMAGVTGITFTMVFFPSFVHHLGLSAHHYLSIITAGLIVTIIATPIIGYQVTLHNIHRFIIAGLLVYIILPIPMFILVGAHPETFALPAQIILFIPVMLFQPILFPLTALFFPTEIRYTGVALTTNIVSCVFAGTTPLISTFLLHATHANVAPALYLAVVALCSLITLAYKNRLLVHNRLLIQSL